jgi:hypothetical protein
VWLLPGGRRGLWQEVGEAPDKRQERPLAGTGAALGRMQERQAAGRRQERLLAGGRSGTLQEAGSAPGRRQERLLAEGMRKFWQEAGAAHDRRQERERVLAGGS